MSIQTTRRRMADFLKDIHGVRNAFSSVPRTLQRAELPAFVIFPGRADYDLRTYGEQIAQEVRIYEAVLYVAEAGDGTEGVAEELCEPFIPLVKAHCLARTGLNRESLAYPSGIVADMELFGDGAPAVRPFPRNDPTKLYAAVPFYFRIKELNQITYRD